ncbi:MAG: energy-coupling factor ABC transporter ATP-binding protein [Candidatus Methanomethylicia archaeon]|nr:energy-coupling factor ABC transporter ATP-binding protein [Candidatus Methanomethylicia archaeon]MCQ5374113.1 energy-coupling factor ABC transporter ATP-binding protein [Candidatus Methanomethylicia archaeon]
MIAISVKDLTYYYPRRRDPALVDINLEISSGEFVLITGPSGGGKSTLCRCLNGLIPNFYGGRLSGKINVMGIDVASATTSELSRHVGMVFQNPEDQITRMSVEAELAFGLENLGVEREEIYKRIREVAKLLRIEDLLNRSVEELSSGQQQKVAIGSVLVMRPEILVLDEPTSELDPRSARDLIDLIARLNRELGMTIVIVEHRLNFILEKADRLVIVNRGRVAVDDSPQEALRSREVGRLGASLPKVVQLYHALSEMGFTLSKVPLSIEQLETELRGASAWAH